jgi:hypothetical protein
MALTERSRSALYQVLTDLMEDEEAVGEIVSFFPARDIEEPATKEFVAAQMSDVRAEFAVVRAEIADLRADLTSETASLRADLIEQMAAMQRTYIQWTLGALVSLIGVMLAMGFLRAP